MRAWDEQVTQEKLVNAKDLLFIALGIDIGVTVLVAGTDLWAVNALNDIRSGVLEIDNYESAVSRLKFWDSFANVLILTAIGVGLALFSWLAACYEYAKERFKATGFVHEGWKAWGWIVPLVNLYKPYQVLNEIYKVGAVDHGGGEEWSKSSSSGILLVWWIFWIIAHMFMWSIVKQALRSASRGDITLDQSIGMHYGSIAACAMSLLVAGLWFLVVGNLTRRLLDRPAEGTPTRSSNSSMSAVSMESYSSDKAPPKNHAVSPTNASVDEERIYADIAKELEDGTADKGLWTRVFAECGGDDKQTKVLYIRQRAERLISAEREALTETKLSGSGTDVSTFPLIRSVIGNTPGSAAEAVFQIFRVQIENAGVDEHKAKRLISEDRYSMGLMFGLVDSVIQGRGIATSDDALEAAEAAYMKLFGVDGPKILRCCNEIVADRDFMRGVENGRSSGMKALFPDDDPRLGKALEYRAEILKMQN